MGEGGGKSAFSNVGENRYEVHAGVIGWKGKGCSPTEIVKVTMEEFVMGLVTPCVITAQRPGRHAGYARWRMEYIQFSKSDVESAVSLPMLAHTPTTTPRNKSPSEHPARYQ